MIPRALIDTGPLVAIPHAADSSHDECTEQLRHLQMPLLTCWPVLTEAAWLLRDSPQTVQQLLMQSHTGVFRILPLEDSAMLWIAAFLRKYRKLNPQIADAAVVYLADRENIDTIFTLDRHDFSIFQLSGERRVQILPIG
jgi:predicted nucleic acid-binding protein